MWRRVRAEVRSEAAREGETGKMKKCEKIGAREGKVSLRGRAAQLAVYVRA